MTRTELTATYTSTSTLRILLDDDRELSWLGAFDAAPYGRFFLFIDQRVDALWGERVRGLLQRHGRAIISCCIEASEDQKTLATATRLIEHLLHHECGASDLVIAVGGGVVLDLVAFVASIYVRGLPLLMVPTTLMAQMDAAIGGKTCINTSIAKNTIGTLYGPSLIYDNLHFLSTTTAYQMRQGLSECFKYGLLAAPNLLEQLERHRAHPSTETMLDIVRQAIGARVAVRKVHPLASNLGHTFGHAIERLADYRIAHGDAISAGTVLSLHFALSIGITDKRTVDDIISRMRQLGLNLHIQDGTDAEALVRVMLRDKKAAGASLDLVLIRGIGQPFYDGERPFYRTSVAALQEFLVRLLPDYPYTLPDAAKSLQDEDTLPGD
jgi:3-dehydroquinate synthase